MGIDDLLKAMKAADPERLKRLEDMGYDTSKVYFHGSPRADIKEFKAGKSGRDMYGEGVYFTSEPDYANKFADSDEAELMARNFAENPKFGASDSGSLNKEWANTVYPVFLKNPDFSVNSEVDKKVKAEFVKKLMEQGQETRTAKQIEDNYNLLNFIRSKLYSDETSDIFKKAGKKNLELPDNMALVTGDPEENIKSIWAKGLEKKGLMSGVAAAPMVSMNPLEPLSDILGGYRGVQEKVADAITERTSFVKPDSTQKALGRAVIDPLNLIEGPAALGAMFIDAITPRKENDAKER